MEKQGSQLTPQEAEEFNRLKMMQNGIEDSTFKQALSYYLQYRSRAEVLLSDSGDA